jgi:shikimate dehydrogenase
MKQYGLIGKTLSHSFSKRYFDVYFKDKPDCLYDLYELESIDMLPQLVSSKHPLGLNVTIPYKQSVLPFLDVLSEEAKAVGAVNVVKLDYNSDTPVLNGFNTDVYGFEMSLQPLLHSYHDKAIILGTGGASKAVAYILDKLNIDYLFVSREKEKNAKIINYQHLSSEIISSHLLIINTTPVGMYPDTTICPQLNFEAITSKHLFYDLIYNPAKTMLLKEAERRGAIIKNGMDMLILQAQKSWEIWNGG